MLRGWNFTISSLVTFALGLRNDVWFYDLKMMRSSHTGRLRELASTCVGCCHKISQRYSGTNPSQTTGSWACWLFICIHHRLFDCLALVLGWKTHSAPVLQPTISHFNYISLIVFFFLFKKSIWMWFQPPEGMRSSSWISPPLPLFHSIYQQPGVSWSAVIRDLM